MKPYRVDYIRLIIVGVVLMLSVNAWADCRVIEYAELKDSDQQELAVLLSENMKQWNILSDRRMDLYKAPGNKQIDKLITDLYAKIDICVTQSDAIIKMFDKKYPNEKYLPAVKPIFPGSKQDERKSEFLYIPNATN